MHLTNFTDYSMRALLFLAAHSEQNSSITEIAEFYGLSRHHLVKVIHRLGQLGYVETTRGKGGGIRLAQGAGKLRLGDLVEQLEPNMTMVECFDPETNTCRVTQSCRFKGALARATRSYIATLNEHTLDSVAIDQAFF